MHSLSIPYNAHHIRLLSVNFTTMQLLTFILYYTWGDRGVAKLLLLCAFLLFCYRKYRAWRISRRYKAIEGKVILLTGASSGLGEGIKL